MSTLNTGTTDKEVIANFFNMLLTVFVWIPWFMVTIYLAVFKDWAFFDNPQMPAWQHIVFYGWLIVSLPFFAWLTLKKIWKLF